MCYTNKKVTLRLFSIIEAKNSEKNIYITCKCEVQNILVPQGTSSYLSPILYTCIILMELIICYYFVLTEISI